MFLKRYLEIAGHRKYLRVKFLDVCFLEEIKETRARVDDSMS